MAIQPWALYNLAKYRIGAGLLNLSTPNFRIALFTPSSNFDTASLSIYPDLTAQVSNANGYLTGGVDLSGETWQVGSAADIYAFDAADPTWTATGGAIVNVGGAALYVGNANTALEYLLCRSSLSTVGFTVEQNNSLTVVMNTAGVFTMQ